MGGKEKEAVKEGDFIEHPLHMHKPVSPSR